MKDEKKNMDLKMEETKAEMNLMEVRIHNLEGLLEEAKKEVQVLVRMRK